MEYLSKSTVNGFTVTLHHDYDAEDPRDWSHGAELVYGHRRYNFPNDAEIDFDDFDSWTHVADYLKVHEDALLVLPVYMIDHSGLAFRVGRSFAAEDPGQWDSGVIGLAYVTPTNWAETQGSEWTGSDEQLEQARKLIESDVETYGQYVNGDVYGYQVTDPLDGEVVDSCWGFFGFDYAESEAASAAEALTHQVKCTGTLNRLTGEVEHPTGECQVHNLCQFCGPDKFGQHGVGHAYEHEHGAHGPGQWCPDCRKLSEES